MRQCCIFFRFRFIESFFYGEVTAHYKGESVYEGLIHFVWFISFIAIWIIIFNRKCWTPHSYITLGLTDCRCALLLPCICAFTYYNLLLFKCICVHFYSLHCRIMCGKCFILILSSSETAATHKSSFFVCLQFILISGLRLLIIVLFLFQKVVLELKIDLMNTSQTVSVPHLGRYFLRPVPPHDSPRCCVSPLLSSHLNSLQSAASPQFPTGVCAVTSSKTCNIPCVGPSWYASPYCVITGKASPIICGLWGPPNCFM